MGTFYGQCENSLTSQTYTLYTQTHRDIAKRYRNLIATYLPSDTKSIHFCCDRYKVKSLKSAERQRSEGKGYEVDDQYGAPDLKSFFSVSHNKAALLQYICEKWKADEEETHSSEC